MMRYHQIYIVCFVFLWSISVGANEQRLLILGGILTNASQDITTPIKKQTDKLKDIEIEVNSLHEKTPNSPVVWYLKSLIEDAKIRIVLRKLDKPYDQSIEVYKKKSVEAFTRAMELDETYEPHLTADMYYWKAWLLPLDLKLEAYRRVLNFEHFGEYPKMRDNVYGRMLSALYDAGRYEEAIELMNQMTADPKWLDIWENPENEVLAIKEKARRFEQKIKERDSSKDASQETKPAQSKTKIPAVQYKPEQTHKPATPKIEPAPDEVDNRVWYFVLGVLVMIVIGIILLRRRSKK